MIKKTKIDLVIPKKASELLTIDELPPVNNYLSTGCTILDLAISNRIPGGFPVGRISHVYGTESSAKSVIACEPIGSAQRQGGKGWYIDSEGTFDFERAHSLFGIDCESLNYVSAENMKDDLTIEYLFDTIIPDAEKEALQIGKPCIVSIDSLSAIPSKPEIDEGISDKTYGTTRAKALSKGFRKHIWNLNKSGLSLIFIDQIRQNVGVVFGKQYTFSGGEALKFYASCRVRLSVIKKFKNKFNRIIGVEVEFEVDKNKIAPPFRHGSFYLVFDYGIDDIWTNFVWLRENDMDNESRFYPVPGTEKKFQALVDAITFVEHNNLEEELQRKVYKVWEQIYQTMDRKQRVR